VAESVPRGEHRVLKGAAHSSIHIDRPDAVVEAIRDLLDWLTGDGLRIWRFGGTCLPQPAALVQVMT
jgi:hypothetical protein